MGAALRDPLNRRLAALAAALGGAYLLLYSRGLTVWLLDIPCAIVALLLWLGRKRAEPLLGAIGIAWLIAARHLRHPALVAAADLAFFAAVFLGGARRLEAWLAQPARPMGKGTRAAGLAVGAGFLVFFALHGARQTWLMVAPERRRAFLEKVAPSFPIHDPATLSPLAARLRAHVLKLSVDIGERSAYDPAAQERAKEYVLAELRKTGLSVRVLPYQAEGKQDFLRTAPYYNLEAVLPGDKAGGAWIIGAHYDTVVGTPGADDDASGVAVLIEAITFLKKRSGGREIRFVAFAAEEPPAFGSRNMGSCRYARLLREEGVAVHAMLSLEMLGYYNPRPGSQLYPPFLHLLYPDRGDSLGLISNLSSALLLKRFTASWRQKSTLTLHATVLPSVASSLALSDQLNFWTAGYPAVLLTDTAFFRAPNYHQATDTAEKLDYETMAEAARAVAAVIAAL